MRIVFSHSRYSGTQAPLAAAAKVQSNIYVSVDWKNYQECSLKLLTHSDRAASSRAHEAFIAALFEQDPGADVRTARARYKGIEDYKRQKARQ